MHAGFDPDDPASLVGHVVVVTQEDNTEAEVVVTDYEFDSGEHMCTVNYGQANAATTPIPLWESPESYRVVRMHPDFGGSGGGGGGGVPRTNSMNTGGSFRAPAPKAPKRKSGGSRSLPSGPPYNPVTLAARLVDPTTTTEQVAQVRWVQVLTGGWGVAKGGLWVS
jgi:hypothetical protein